jgi:hypothetical protein
MTSNADYPLGNSDAEHERLKFQARVLRQWTDRFLRAGGLRPGMSVLDLGSGLGDVALLAAGITRSSAGSSLPHRHRTAQASANTSF